MARPLRLELPGRIYHVTSRGDRREHIYEDDEDRQQWLTTLGKTCKRYNRYGYYSPWLATLDKIIAMGNKRFPGNSKAIPPSACCGVVY